MIKARLVLAGAVAAGGAFLATPADAYCTNQGYDIARACYDYVAHVAPVQGGDVTTVSTAQAVCVPSANCDHIGRSGVTYNHRTREFCYAVAGNGWHCRT